MLVEGPALLHNVQISVNGRTDNGLTDRWPDEQKTTPLTAITC